MGLCGEQTWDPPRTVLQYNRWPLRQIAAEMLGKERIYHCLKVLKGWRYTLKNAQCVSTNLRSIHWASSQLSRSSRSGSSLTWKYAYPYPIYTIWIVHEHFNSLWHTFESSTRHLFYFNIVVAFVKSFSKN